MSRYIDADALIKEMSEKHRPNFHEDLKSYHMWIMWYWALKEAPSIDIVRCKECKHREKYPCNEIEFYECSHLRLHGTKVGVEDDWFCADGEREGER